MVGMQVSQQMIQAAVSKAMELGVLPRRGVSDDIATNNEIMAEILQAAVDTDSGVAAEPAEDAPGKQ